MAERCARACSVPSVPWHSVKTTLLYKYLLGLMGVQGVWRETFLSYRIIPSVASAS